MRFLLVVAGLLMLGGCMSFSDRAMRPVADSIQAQIPEFRLEKEFAVSMGKGMFNLLDIVMVDSADISKMDRVNVAIYNVYGNQHQVDFDTLDFAESLRAKRGPQLVWETIVKIRDHGEQVWVLAGVDNARQTLDAVAVFVLDQNELVLINVEGKLEQLLDFAMKPATDHRGSMREQRRRS